jgi:hypothetical protein
MNFHCSIHYVNVSIGPIKGRFHKECVVTLLLGRLPCSGCVAAMKTAETGCVAAMEAAETGCVAAMKAAKLT